MSADPALTRLLLAIAREAAAHLATGYRGQFVVEHKGETDLVTRFDRESEDIVRERVARELPGVDLIAEESGGTASGARPVLYADPLDGTTNFAHGHPFFCVSLGVLEGDALTHAAVVAPALGTEYHATRGHGAFRGGVRCRVSDTRELVKSLLATGFPYDGRSNPENNLREFCELTLRTQGVRRCGSAALDLCLTADGTFDAYWERHLKPWDLAAGALMVHEAGGRLSDFEDGPADVRKGWLVASNGHLHAPLLAALRDARLRPVVRA